MKEVALAVGLAGCSLPFSGIDMCNDRRTIDNVKADTRVPFGLSQELSVGEIEAIFNGMKLKGKMELETGSEMEVTVTFRVRGYPDEISLYEDEATCGSFVLFSGPMPVDLEISTSLDGQCVLDIGGLDFIYHDASFEAGWHVNSVQRAACGFPMLVESFVIIWSDIGVDAFAGNSGFEDVPVSLRYAEGSTRFPVEPVEE